MVVMLWIICLLLLVSGGLWCLLDVTKNALKYSRKTISNISAELSGMTDDCKTLRSELQSAQQSITGLKAELMAARETHQADERANAKLSYELTICHQKLGMVGKALRGDWQVKVGDIATRNGEPIGIVTSEGGQ